jgi:hypothetical protein
MAIYFIDVAKVMEAFHGKVTARDFFTFDKYARTNTPYLSERFMTKIAPSLMLETGSSSAGTALTSMGQAVIGGKMTRRSAEEMIKLGLIDPSSVLRTTSTSTQLKPGSVKGWQTAVSDPDQWVQQVLMPAMISHGINKDMDQRLAFGMIFGNRTAEQIANIFGKPESVARITKDAAMLDQAKGLPGAKEYAANDPTTATQSFTQAWDNLLIALGSPLVPVAVKFLNSVTDEIKSLTAAAAAHPGAVKILGEIAIGLGATLVVMGAAALAVAGVMAAIAGGPVMAAAAAIGAVATFVGTFIALNWDAVEYDFKRLGQMIGGFFNWLLHGDGTIKPGGYAQAFEGYLNSQGSTPNVPPPPSAGHQPASHVYMDGRIVGKLVAAQMGGLGNGPAMSSALFDGRAGYTQVGATAGGS